MIHFVLVFNYSTNIRNLIDIKKYFGTYFETKLLTYYLETKWNSDIYNDAIFALQSRLLQRLGERDESPLYRRIVVGENKKSETTCITLDYIISYGFKKTNISSTWS